MKTQSVIPVWNPYRHIRFLTLNERYKVFIDEVFVGSYPTLKEAMKARDAYEALAR